MFVLYKVIYFNVILIQSILMVMSDVNAVYTEPSKIQQFMDTNCVAQFVDGWFEWICYTLNSIPYETSGLAILGKCIFMILVMIIDLSAYIFAMWYGIGWAAQMRTVKFRTIRDRNNISDIYHNLKKCAAQVNSNNKK